MNDKNTRYIRFDSNIYGNVFSTLCAIAKSAKGKNRKMLEYIYWDANEKTLVATNGGLMFACAIKNEEFQEELGGENLYCTLQYEGLIEVTDEKTVLERDNKMKYVSWKDVIPVIEKNNLYERMDISTSLYTRAKRITEEKKYIPAAACELVARETGFVFSPKYFDLIKDVLPEFSDVYMQHIPTNEEWEEMSTEERRKANDRVLPLMMRSANEVMTVVMMPMSETEDMK